MFTEVLIRRYQLCLISIYQDIMLYGIIYYKDTHIILPFPFKLNEHR